MIKEYSGMASLPFRFLTPFSVRPSRLLRNSYFLQAKAEWQENRLKAERARFLSEEERRAKPETEPLLTRWGKRGVFSSHLA